MVEKSIPFGPESGVSKAGWWPGNGGEQVVRLLLRYSVLGVQAARPAVQVLILAEAIVQIRNHSRGYGYRVRSISIELLG